MRQAFKYCALAAISFMIVSCSGVKKDVVVKLRADYKSLLIQGNELFLQGRYDDAAKMYGRAMEISSSIDDRAGIAESKNNLGQIYLVSGDFAGAKGLFSEALLINRSVGNKMGEAANLVNLGSLSTKEKNFSEAGISLNSALQIYRESGPKNSVGELQAKLNLGIYLFESGDARASKAYLEDVISLASAKKRHRIAAAAFFAQGDAKMSEGDARGAIFFYERALAKDKLVEFRVGIGKDLLSLANAHLSAGELSLAREYYSRALKVYESLKFKKEIDACMAGLKNSTDSYAQ